MLTEETPVQLLFYVIKSCETDDKWEVTETQKESYPRLIRAYKGNVEQLIRSNDIVVNKSIFTL